MISLGAPLFSPSPIYDAEQDEILCSVTTTYGAHGWEISPIKLSMHGVLCSIKRKANYNLLRDDLFRWFARFLWEGKILSEFTDLKKFMNDSPSLLTQKNPSSKVNILISELSRAGVCSARDI